MIRRGRRASTALSPRPARTAPCRATGWPGTPGCRLLTFLPHPEQVFESGTTVGIPLEGERGLEVGERSRMVTRQLPVERSTGQRAAVTGVRRRRAGLAAERVSTTLHRRAHLGFLGQLHRLAPVGAGAERVTGSKPRDSTIEDGEGEARADLGGAREIGGSSFRITGDEPRVAPVEQDLGVVGRELQRAREVCDAAGRVAETDACRATVRIRPRARLLAHALVERGQRTTVAALFVEHEAPLDRRLR